MGNIGNKGALVFSVLVDPVCHVVQGYGKIAHFVLGFHWNAITPISVGIFGSPLMITVALEYGSISDSRERSSPHKAYTAKKNHLKEFPRRPLRF